MLNLEISHMEGFHSTLKRTNQIRHSEEIWFDMPIIINYC